MQLGKTRLFLSSPVEHVVSLNRLCQNFNNKMIEKHVEIFSTLGINKFHGGFKRLYYKLITKSKKLIGCLDVSNYDGGLLPFFFNLVIDFRWMCLKPRFRTLSNLLRFKALYYDIVHTIIMMPDGQIIVKHQGMPSGCGNTAYDNTLILYIAICYLFLLITNIRSYLEFKRLVMFFGNGDDSIFSVLKVIKHLFNPRVIMQVAPTINFSITLETVGTDVDGFVNVDEAVYLSQKFVRFTKNNIEYVVPALNDLKLLCSACVGLKTQTLDQSVYRIASLSFECAAYPDLFNIFQEYVESFQHLVVDSEIKLGLATLHCTYDEMLSYHIDYESGLLKFNLPVLQRSTV